MSDHTSEDAPATANGNRTRWASLAILGAVCAAVIGFYAWRAHPAMYELLGSGAQDSYYNLLVRGFRDGQLNVKREAPAALAQPGVAANLNWSDSVTAGLADLSYYKGKLYLYFGVTPALLLFWPCAALTGHYLPHKDAVVIFFSAGFLAGAGLLFAVRRRYFKEAGTGVAAAGALALGLANLAPAMLGRCDVYVVPISCGYALTLMALAAVWAALHEERHRWRWLAAASLAYGLAVGARPSLLLGAVILLIPVAQARREKRPTGRLLLAAGGPIVLIGLGLMVYNTLRFDHPLELGQRYQLPFVTHQQFSPRYLWFNFRVGFLEPARWSGRFPFVHDIAPPAQPAAYYNVDHPFGVLTNMPLVWLALAAPLAWRNRPEEERSRLRWFLGALALLFGMCALPLCLHDSMCLRYEMEYASPLVLLAVLGALGLERALAGQPVRLRAARLGWGLLLTFSVVFNLWASFQLQADSDLSFSYALLREGKVDAAILQYRKVLEARPDYALARNNLGSALASKGDLKGAAEQFREALENTPDYQDAVHNLGKILLLKGDLGGAIACYRQAIALNPSSADAYANLGLALYKKAEIKEAVDAWQRSLEIIPDQLYVLNNLAWLLATTPDAALRDGAKAVALATQADQLSGGGNPMMLHTLAAACAETGDYERAAATARRGLESATGQKNGALAATLQKEIQLYEAGKPVRENTEQGIEPAPPSGDPQRDAPAVRAGPIPGGAPTGRVAPP